MPLHMQQASFTSFEPFCNVAWALGHVWRMRGCKSDAHEMLISLS